MGLVHSLCGKPPSRPPTRGQLIALPHQQPPQAAATAAASAGRAPEASTSLDVLNRLIEGLEKPPAVARELRHARELVIMEQSAAAHRESAAAFREHTAADREHTAVDRALLVEQLADSRAQLQKERFAREKERLNNQARPLLMCLWRRNSGS